MSFTNEFCLFSCLESSGGYSDVVKIVYSILAINTNAPMAKAILTDGGTIPGHASLDTPNLVTTHGRLLAIHVPIPMISVCTTNP